MLDKKGNVQNLKFFESRIELLIIISKLKKKTRQNIFKIKIEFVKIEF